MMPRHSGTEEFYLCQSRKQVIALQHDLPLFKLRHASETYILKMKGGWPVHMSHRLSDDEPAMRVMTDIESETSDTITVKITTGDTFPDGLSETVYTFRRTGSTWILLRREAPPIMHI